MKRISPLLLLALSLTLIFAPIAWAAATPVGARMDRSPGAPIAHALSTVTGIAISPLLGTGAYGAYKWFTTEEAARVDLPWYAQPKFWLPALLIVAAVAAKDAFGTAVPPGLKKPLDVLEIAENKFSGLIAAGAVIPFAMDSFTRILVESAQTAHLHGTGLAMIPTLAMSWAPVLDLLTIPLGIAVFAIVWMGSHALNVLILLSPWGAVDAGLKAARTALLGLITITATLNPMVAAVLSIGIIVFAYLIAGWAFRLTVFGTIMCWDFFTRRRNRFVLAPDGNRLFAGASFDGVPVRTYGHLVRRDDGGLEFVYKPWLVLQPRTVPVPAAPGDLAVGAGLLFSVLVRNEGGTLFLLPERYRGHEEDFAAQYQLGGGVQPAGLRKLWGSVRELFGGRPAPEALPAPAAQG